MLCARKTYSRAVENRSNHDKCVRARLFFAVCTYILYVMCDTNPGSLAARIPLGAGATTSSPHPLRAHIINMSPHQRALNIFHLAHAQTLWLRFCFFFLAYAYIRGMMLTIPRASSSSSHRCVAWCARSIRPSKTRNLHTRSPMK